MPSAAPRSLSLLALLCATACGQGPLDTRDPIDDDDVEVPADAVAWLTGAAVPFESVAIEAPHADLQFLRDWVGDARIVALGENTHGARDFFQMKARMLRYLVEEMGFDAFAIEATWPEANRLDRYVRTGEGDPASLLAGLYFWTWNTAAVLEMIEWMRQHNAAGGDVGFYGFDMQYPGMAIHNVLGYLDIVDPDGASEFGDRLNCLSVHANGPNGRFPEERFDARDESYRTGCVGDLAWVEATLAHAEGDSARRLRGSRVARISVG